MVTVTLSGFGFRSTFPSLNFHKHAFLCPLMKVQETADCSHLSDQCNPTLGYLLVINMTQQLNFLEDDIPFKL